MVTTEQLQFDEVQFQESIRSSALTDIPDLTLQQAQSRGCAWIVEMEPLSLHPTQPVRSHFNVLNPLKSADCSWSMDASIGVIQCKIGDGLNWECKTVPTRIEQMYEWSDVALVKEGDAVCIAFDGLRCRSSRF